MKLHVRLSVFVGIILLSFVTKLSAGKITRYASDASPGAGAVRVTRGALAHTRMCIGTPQSPDDVGMADVIQQLQEIARGLNSSLTSLVKLNVYVAEPDARLIETVKQEIQRTWPGETQPAVTLIPTPILSGKRKVAADAVIVVPPASQQVIRYEDKAAVMPADKDILYVSGRAAKGDAAAGTAGTMKQLFDVLAHLGSRPSDVVQVKAFIKPMSDWKTFDQEIRKSFGELEAPPVVYVEWTSTSYPTEIELIAAAPEKTNTNDSVTYITPPGDQASPVYSRIARVHSNDVIYIGGLLGSNSSTAEQEIRTLYDELTRLAELSGSDLRHLAKATYYVSSNDCSTTLNKLRPGYYDPKRPPAASKISVPSVGVNNRGLLVDMVAVPVSAP